MQPTRIELLQRMPVFGAIRDDALQLLLSLARSVSVPAGEYFFRENDQALSMFVLEAGRAVVLKSWQGRDYVLHTLGAGDCFVAALVVSMLEGGYDLTGLARSVAVHVKTLMDAGT